MKLNWVPYTCNYIFNSILLWIRYDRQGSMHNYFVKSKIYIFASEVSDSFSSSLAKRKRIGQFASKDENLGMQEFVIYPKR